MTFRNQHYKGAVLIESAIVIPLLILLVIGALGVAELFYAKSVVTFALQEGIRLAQQDERLKVDLNALNPSVPADKAKLDGFMAARDQVVARTASIISKNLGSSVQLIPVRINDGKVPSTSLSLAFLPPTFAALPLSGWGSEVAFKNDVCDPYTQRQNDGSSSTVAGACARDSRYASLLKTQETEFHAAVKMKGLFLKSVVKDFVVHAPLYTGALNGGGNVYNNNNNLNDRTPRIVTFLSEYHRLMMDAQFRSWYEHFTNGNQTLKPSSAARRNDEGWAGDPQTLDKLCEFFMNGTVVKHSTHRNGSDNNNFWTYWDRGAQAWKVIYSSWLDDNDVDTITCLGMDGIVRGAAHELLPSQPMYAGNSRVVTSYRGL